MARPTGFEPAISSVTGRRDRPSSLRAHKLCVIVANFLVRGKGEYVWVAGTYACGIIQSVDAAVAQLVERRFRKA